MSCFLWQKSAFYNKARINIHAWQLRWFTFFIDKIISVPDRSDFMSRVLVYPPFDFIDVDETKRLICIHTDGTRLNYVFLCPSDNILDLVLKKMHQIQALSKEAREHEFKSQMAAKYNHSQEHITDAMINADALQAEMVLSLVAWPNKESLFHKFFHVLLFPFKFLIHITIPDVRSVSTKAGPTFRTAITSVFMSIIWLIPWTYIMVLSLEILGHRLHINDVIMGLTFSAAGTAIPNYIASHVAATQGFSNMAISNAIGSNTFNILICLGVPWITFTTVQDGSYNEKWDRNIKSSMIVMILVHFIFTFILLYSGFKLNRVSAVLFLMTYLVFVIVALSFSCTS